MSSFVAKFVCSFYSQIRSHNILIVFPAANPLNLDLDIILLRSGNGSDSYLNAQKKFAMSVVDSLEVSPNATQIGLVSYGEIPSVELRIGESHDKNAIKKSIFNIRVTGDSGDLSKALEMAYGTLLAVHDGARPNVPKTILVFVGDKSLGNKRKLNKIAKTLKDEKIKLVILGIDKDTNKNTVELLAYNKKSVFLSKTANEIKTLLKPALLAIQPGMVNSVSHYIVLNKF